MIKKFLLPLIFLFSTSMATELTAEFLDKGTYTNGAIDVRISYCQDNDVRDRTKDWVAVYRKGSSTEWKNVITWAWVKDLGNELPNDNCGHVFRDTHIVEVGEYVIRLFKNNSYTIDKSLDFTIKEVDSFLFDIKKIGIDLIEPFGFDDDKFVPNEQDWIGIYKEGDDNTWGNVVQWGWVKDSVYYWFRLDKNLYQNGIKYQARYFLNNSYRTFKQTEPFYMGQLPDSEKRVIDSVLILERDDGTYAKTAVSSRYIESSKDWVGIFNDDVNHTDLSNLIAWTYVNKNEYNQDLEILKPELINRVDTYRAVLFRNDSYTTFGKKLTFKVRVAHDNPQN